MTVLLLALRRVHFCFLWSPPTRADSECRLLSVWSPALRVYLSDRQTILQFVSWQKCHTVYSHLLCRIHNENRTPPAPTSTTGSFPSLPFLASFLHCGGHISWKRAVTAVLIALPSIDSSRSVGRSRITQNSIFPPDRREIGGGVQTASGSGWLAGCCIDILHAAVRSRSIGAANTNAAVIFGYKPQHMQFLAPLSVVNFLTA